MTEYCKHGMDMATTCRKCGRTKVVEVPNFKAKKDSFTNSIDRLEETIRKMQVELANDPGTYREPAAAPVEPPPARVSPAPAPAAAAPEEEEETPPPAPPQKFPWQRG
jgi:transcription elongation factor Elf1